MRGNTVQTLEEGFEIFSCRGIPPIPLFLFLANDQATGMTKISGGYFGFSAEGGIYPLKKGFVVDYSQPLKE